MEFFTTALITVACMLACAIPGYITVKSKMIKAESISSFAVILMYVCQPALTISSFDKVNFTTSLVKDLGIFLAISFVLQIIVLVAVYFIFSKKRDDVRYRVANVAFCFGNVAFMGVPILEALYPNNPDVVVFSIAFLIGMNLLGWTLASAIITRDKKYISVRKAIFNPATISLIVALPLFFTHTKLPDEVASMISILGKMTTPLCMIIMGMRLATVEVKSIFNQPLQYITVAFKQIAFPLIAMAIVWFMPLDLLFRQALVILCCTPIASVVLNFAELLGEGQGTAANLVLLGTASSIITIPIMMLIMQAMPV